MWHIWDDGHFLFLFSLATEIFLLLPVLMRGWIFGRELARNLCVAPKKMCQGLAYKRLI